MAHPVRLCPDRLPAGLHHLHQINWKGTPINKLAAVLLLFAFTGCAQVMCLKQATPFKPTTLEIGYNRSAVLQELGAPVVTDQSGSKLTDTYIYVDGEAGNMWGWKILRVVAYTAGDLFTLWLDQLAWMPMEQFIFDGSKYCATVEYEKQNDGPWLVKTQPTLALAKNSPSK